MHSKMRKFSTIAVVNFFILPGLMLVAQSATSSKDVSPNIGVILSVSSTSVKVGEKVRFDVEIRERGEISSARALSFSSNRYSYKLFFGDGSIEFGSTDSKIFSVFHTYRKTGEFTAYITVTDRSHNVQKSSNKVKIEVRDDDDKRPLCRDVTVTVKVTKIHALEDMDFGTEADFYLIIYIDGYKYKSPVPLKKDKNTIIFGRDYNWVAKHTIRHSGSGDKEVFIKIQLWEADVMDDDHCDIDEDGGSDDKDCEITYSIKYNDWWGDDCNSTRFQTRDENGPGHAVGDCGLFCERAEIWFEVTDDWDWVEPRNCAIIICGGIRDDVQSIFDRTAEHAYQTFRSLGFDDEYIYYLNLYDHPGVDATTSRKNVRRAFVEWLPEHMGTKYGVRTKDCFVYIIDHGSPDGVVYVGDIDEKITGRDLERWIEEGIGNNYDVLTIVIDACFSGTFIPYLSGRDRIIITSTDADNFAYGWRGGESVFGKPFFDALGRGKSYGEAWEEADAAIDFEKPDSINNTDNNQGKETIIDGNRTHQSKMISLKDIFHKIGKKRYLHSLRDLLNLIEKWNSLKPFLRIADPGSGKWGIRHQNPQIDDDGDGIGHGTKWADDLPIDGDGDFAEFVYPHP